TQNFQQRSSHWWFDIRFRLGPYGSLPRSVVCTNRNRCNRYCRYAFECHCRDLGLWIFKGKTSSLKTFMDWFKKLLITAIWISIAQTLQAQQHYNAWFRGTLSVPVGKKFKIDTEFQHRRQNG